MPRSIGLTPGMQIVVVGKGGREHALVRALRESGSKPDLFSDLPTQPIPVRSVSVSPGKQQIVAARAAASATNAAANVPSPVRSATVVGVSPKKTETRKKRRALPTRPLPNGGREVMF